MPENVIIKPTSQQKIGKYVREISINFGYKWNISQKTQ